MRSCAILLFALATACVADHAPAAVELGMRDCYACHRANYQAAPNHVGVRATTCADCHRIADWKGLLPGTHPEGSFVITAGPHRATLCADCHDPDINKDSTGGNNVTCIGCHTGAHAMGTMSAKHSGVMKFHWDAARPTFCRDCHPLGLNN